MRAFSCLQDKHEICRLASPVTVSQPPGPLSRRLWKKHTLSYVAHTHSLRKPAGGGSGQTKPRKQSEAGGSTFIRDGSRGRPLERLFGSAGVCKAGSWYRCQKLFLRDVQIRVLRRSLWYHPVKWFTSQNSSFPTLRVFPSAPLLSMTLYILHCPGS